MKHTLPDHIYVGADLGICGCGCGYHIYVSCADLLPTPEGILPRCCWVSAGSPGMFYMQFFDREGMDAWKKYGPKIECEHTETTTPAEVASWDQFIAEVVAKGKR